MCQFFWNPFVSMHTCACGSQRPMSGVFLGCTVPHSLRQGLSLKTGLFLARLASKPRASPTAGSEDPQATAVFNMDTQD